MNDDPNKFELVYVMPSGVCVSPLKKGYKTVRVCKGILENAETGLIAEMDKGKDPVPWESMAVRDEALRELKALKSIKIDLKQRLIRHILATHYFAPIRDKEMC